MSRSVTHSSCVARVLISAPVDQSSSGDYLHYTLVDHLHIQLLTLKIETERKVGEQNNDNGNRQHNVSCGSCALFNC